MKLTESKVLLFKTSWINLYIGMLLSIKRSACLPSAFRQRKGTTFGHTVSCKLFKIAALNNSKKSKKNYLITLQILTKLDTLFLKTVQY